MSEANALAEASAVGKACPMSRASAVGMEKSLMCISRNADMVRKPGGS